MLVIALNLSSPVQSWAGRSVIKTRVDTRRSPSKRAIQGLVAAAYGYSRISRNERYPEIIEAMSVNEEIDGIKANDLIKSPGSVVRDYQIIGNRADEGEYLNAIGRMLNLGKKANKTLVADAQGGTAVINRTYLADARFLVLLQGRSDSETEEILGKLENPVFSPYLGKKAFSPTFPFVLGAFDHEQVVKSSEGILSDLDDRMKRLTSGQSSHQAQDAVS